MFDSSFPKKRFGQNFLSNKHIASKIVDSININSNDTIVEIGPGRGILTEIINTKECKKKIAVEIDSDLASQLQIDFPDIQIYQQDILSFSFSNVYQQSKNKIKVFGNIPYNITSPILFHLLENSKYLSQAVIMMQKEVAERLLATKDNKEYGILTILVSAQTKIDKLFTVNRNNFYPKPKVDSMVVHLEFVKNATDIENYLLFNNIVKTTFNNRRKMLRNSLSNIVNADTLQKIKTVSLNLRPENLSLSDFLNLTNEIASF